MRPHRRTLGLIGIAALGLATVPAPSAGAVSDHQGIPGIITFMRHDDSGYWQVWVANADLTSQRQVTSGDFSSGWPTWKPDGTRLAFESDRTDPDPSDDVVINDVFTMNPDGTDVVQVTKSLGIAGDVSWSPNGKWLTYENALGDQPAVQGIYISRPDGTGIRRVTTMPPDAWWDGSPKFSPDGKKIVFTRFGPDGEGGEQSALYVVNVDGSHETKLDATADLHPGDASWSPDGRTIVFETWGFPATIGADGTHLRDLTPERSEGFAVGADPVYSPDGKQIMLDHGEFTNDGLVSVGLSIMQKNGQQLRYIDDVTTEETEEHQPDWILAPSLGPAA